MADKIILGRIYTMDGDAPRAEAIAIRDGIIVCVGDKESVFEYCGKNAEVLDFGESFICPGLMEAHAHPGTAGNKLIGQADLTAGKSMEEYFAIMAEYVKANPGRDIYMGRGWNEIGGLKPDAYMADGYFKDVPVIMQTSDGHSALLNHKAMERFGIDANFAKKHGSELVRVFENGEPTGYISENPAMDLISGMEKSVGDMERFILAWQDFAVSNGFTACSDAALEFESENTTEAYENLQKSGRLKIRTYAHSMVSDNTDTPAEEAERIARLRERVNGEYFKVIGAKVFIDGVLESHTAWLCEDYCDEPGYKGYARYSDLNSLSKLIKEAEKKGLNVHAHTIGDGAVKFFLDAVEKSGCSKNMRNASAHLQFMRREDIERMGRLGVIAAAGIMWTGSDTFFYDQAVSYTGDERSWNMYPMRSLVDAGAVVVNHSDYPISTMLSLPIAVFSGTERRQVGYKAHKPEEAITRHEVLASMTKNVAYMWHEEERMGTISAGKIGNIAVFDTDLMEADMDKVLKAECIVTFIDGEIVFKK